MQRFSVALFAFLAILALVLPSQARVTNADRLRRGEPLLPPVRRGTPTYAAKRQNPSGVVTPNTSGRIEVRTLGGTVLGHLQTDGPDHLNVDPNSGDAHFEVAGGQVQYLDPRFPPPYFIGGFPNPVLVGGVNTESFVVTLMDNVENSSPTTWVIDATSDKLTPTWTNPDGSSIASSIFYNPSSDLLWLVGGEDGLDGAEPVDFYLVD
ncbi:hypothetical protein FA95DRAFT_1567339 [Auriscalpium vulgare]|uniref:Uncharacterized protein n=1 Tax=Auriscalpium vulgare TaxID=40419 RepID=A0ACB8R4R4_9AGAM|nr:hypothetical protein FA95DRAFT_1567339 [Auriscalpium vulgare]